MKTAGSLLLRLAIVALLAFLSISITSFAHEAAAAEGVQQAFALLRLRHSQPPDSDTNIIRGFAAG